jgi:hypothetical protein
MSEGNRAQREMVEGYLDGRQPGSPEPSANRSAAYRHGFQSGRDDLARKPSAPYEHRKAEADRIIEENAD